jgi:hypothetical protein
MVEHVELPCPGEVTQAAAQVLRNHIEEELRAVRA